MQGEVRQRRVEAWRVEPPEHEMEAAQGEGWWGLGRGAGREGGAERLGERDSVGGNRASLVSLKPVCPHVNCY